MNIKEQLTHRLGEILQRHVEPIFKLGTKLTIIARTPGNNEADVLVSSEQNLDEIIALVERSKPREVSQMTPPPEHMQGLLASARGVMGTPTGGIRFRTHKPLFGAHVLILQVHVEYGDGPPDAYGLPAYLAGVGWKDATSEDLTHPNIVNRLQEQPTEVG